MSDVGDDDVLDSRFGNGALVMLMSTLLSISQVFVIQIFSCNRV